MEEPPVLVHHKGRRFRRSSARTSSTVKDVSQTLPPPTPPSGKSRESMQALASKASFPYQRFKPLPSIGSTHQMKGSGGDHSDTTIDADLAVDLSSPSPTVSSTEVRALTALTRTSGLRSDRKHSHMSDSRSSSQEGRSATKAAKIETKPPIVTTTQGIHDETRVRRTRGSSKSKDKSKLPVCEPNFEVPPEPSKDAPHTVMIKLRLPEGECIQRRFNYQEDQLGCVVCYACSVMDSKDVDLNSSTRNVTLSNNSVPKVVFSDLSLTLEQAGLVHNTLLHINCED